jgi:hypothetical protein
MDYGRPTLYLGSPDEELEIITGRFTEEEKVNCGYADDEDAAECQHRAEGGGASVNTELRSA